MKIFYCTLLLSLFLAACGGEKVAPAPPAQTVPPAQTTVQSSTTQTSTEAGDAVKGVWRGEVRIDAHAGTAVFNYVGAESGDFVPMRFRTDSPVGAKILAECADEDLCEFEGSVRFLDEPPPENASSVGEIVSVDRVKKLPPENHRP